MAADSVSFMSSALSRVLAMADIEYSSITTFIDNLDKFAKSYKPLKRKMLNAAADVVEPALAKSLESEGLVNTGRTKASIGRSKAIRNGSECVIIGPSGVHHSWINKKGLSGTLRAGHLGYILEYGLPGRNISGKKWMSKAIERTASKAVDAEEKVYNEFLDKHNL